MIQTLEELSLNAWPALQTKLYDGWLLRFAGGYTKRANSVNPLYQSRLPLTEKIAFCEAQYRQQALPTVFKITPASVPAGIDQALAARHYARVDETVVRLLELSQYQCRSPHGILVENSFAIGWLSDFAGCAGLAGGALQSAGQILQNIQGNVITVRKIVDGQTVGCGYGAVERGYIGIFDLIVATSYRNNGFGRDLLDGILNAALAAGVKQAYLAVVAGNTPAERLYHSRGFRELYRYWYRKSTG